MAYTYNKFLQDEKKRYKMQQVTFLMKFLRRLQSFGTLTPLLPIALTTTISPSHFERKRLSIYLRTPAARRHIVEAISDRSSCTRTRARSSSLDHIVVRTISIHMRIGVGGFVKLDEKKRERERESEIIRWRRRMEKDHDDGPGIEPVSNLH